MSIHPEIEFKKTHLQKTRHLLTKVSNSGYTRTYLKKVDQGSWQGAVRRKSGAYTLVCEHFEPIRNTAMEP